jgi:hypothetical protein
MESNLNTYPELQMIQKQFPEIDINYFFDNYSRDNKGNSVHTPIPTYTELIGEVIAKLQTVDDPELLAFVQSELRKRIEDDYMSQTAEFLQPELYIRSLDLQISSLYESEVYDDMIYLKEGLSAFYNKSLDVIQSSREAGSIDEYLNNTYGPALSDPSGLSEEMEARCQLYWTRIIEPALNIESGPFSEVQKEYPDVSWTYTHYRMMSGGSTSISDNDALIGQFAFGELHELVAVKSQLQDARDEAIRRLRISGAGFAPEEPYYDPTYFSSFRFDLSSLTSPETALEIEKAVSELAEKNTLTPEEPSGESIKSPAIPLKGVLIADYDQLPINLRLYLMRDGDQWKLVDLTDPAHGEVYLGGRVGNNSPPERIKEAINAAFWSFLAQNRWPAGEIIVQKPLGIYPDLMWNEWRAYSDGERYRDQVAETAGSISMWAGIAGLVLMVVPIPGSQVLGAALLMGSGAASIVAGGISIIDRLEHETFEWDLKTGFDIATIVTGLVAGAGGFISGFRFALGVAGKGVMTAVGLGLDATWGILLTEHYTREIDRIRNSGLSTEEQETQIRLLIEEAMFTGGLMILGNVAGLKSMFSRKNVKVTAVEVNAAEKDIAAFKVQAAQLEQELAALRAKQERLTAEHQAGKNAGRDGGGYLMMGGLNPKMARDLYNLAVYFLKRGAVAGEMTFAKFKVWLSRQQIKLAYSDKAVNAQLREIWDNALAEHRMANVPELTRLRELSATIPSEHVPPHTEFQSNGRIFEFEVINGKIKFKDKVWNNNGWGYGIYDFVIRENGELVIGEFHTYLLGKGNEARFLSQKTFKGAGKMTIFEGKVEHATNNTGHLKTSRQGSINQTNILKDSGLGVSNITHDPSWAPK